MERLMKNISFLFCWSALVGFAVAMVLVLNVPTTFGQPKKAIIDGRPYQKTEDIMKVKGIKQGEFNKIKDLITVK